MKKIIVFVMVFLTGVSVADEQNKPKETGKKAEPKPDYRVIVEMPADSRLLLRQEMRDNLQTLTLALGQLANGNYNQAAELVEKGMGKSSMGKYKGMSNRPGKYLPEAFHTMGHSMHYAASEFSEAAKTEDPEMIYKALSKLTTYCNACHSSMRLE